MLPFTPASTPTDDSVLTVAVADCILHGKDYTATFREYGRRYPQAGWGAMFFDWIWCDNPAPDNRFGNGSAMRVSPIGFAYDLNKTLDEIRPSYRFCEICQKSVPEAIIAFLESTDYEDAVRKAVSLGGDADTLACMTGGIAQAYYKAIPTHIIEEARRRLPDDFLAIIDEFEAPVPSLTGSPAIHTTPQHPTRHNSSLSAMGQRSKRLHGDSSCRDI